MQTQESCSNTIKSCLDTSISKGIDPQALYHSIITAINSPSLSLQLCQTFDKLDTLIKIGESQSIRLGLICLTQLFKKGYAQGFALYESSLRIITRHFNSLAEKLDDSEDDNLQYQMLNVLSLIAQMLNSDPMHCPFPFTKKFTQNVFMISTQLVEVSTKKKQILRILSVFLIALSKKIKLLREFGLFNIYKAAVLENYSKIEEINTYKRFNKTLLTIIYQEPLSVSELKKFRILQTEALFLNQERARQMLGQIKRRNAILIKDSCKVELDPNLHLLVKSVLT